MSRTLRACLLCLSSTLTLAATCPAADTPATVKYRQANMKALGGHMSAAAALLKGDVDQKPHLEKHLEAVVFGLSVAGDLFPAGSDKGETETLPAVWSQPGDFAKAVTSGREAAQKLASSLKGGADGARRGAFDEAGKACKGCHEGFRKKK